MLPSLLLPEHIAIKLERVEARENAIHVHLVSTQMPARCPFCAQDSKQVHSRYVRKLADLPWAASAVTLCLMVRRFRCRNSACGRKLFTERLDEFIVPVARRTDRLTERLNALALAMGGELGKRIASRLGMPISADTLLRLLRRIKPPTPGAPEAVGIDDWALRKGHTYGTILVDLERNVPFDLLPSRDPVAVAERLQCYPSIKIIARDRFPAYAQACQEALPDATQVTDRFHLLQNCTDALQHVCERSTPVLREVIKVLTASSEDEPRQRPSEHVAVDAEAEPAVNSRAWRRFREVKQLQQRGLSRRAVAQQLQMNRRTVQKYFELSAPPVKVQHEPVPSSVTPYLPYLRQRIAAGCHNRSVLYFELRERGFMGSYHAMWRATRDLLPTRSRQPDGQKRRPKPKVVLTPRIAAWLLMQPLDKRSDRQAQIVELLNSRSNCLAEAGKLALDFRLMLVNRRVDQLDIWLSRAADSNVPEFQRFAAGLRRDYPALKAALTLPWSNGPTEGHNNRLKLLKRSMYGRANFDLLRIRVLCPI